MATAQTKIIVQPKPYRWTRSDYYKMGELGLFEDKRVELIEGEVIEMSPVYGPHATSVTVTGEILRETFGKGWVIREEKPLNLGINSDPEPDVAVVAGKARDFKETHPSTAGLVIEVSDSSLSYDRTHKASLYAKAGIADYWIINVHERQVEVHRRPIIDASAEFGFNYANKMIFTEEDSIRPLAKPKSAIAVADLLP